MEAAQSSGDSPLGEPIPQTDEGRSAATPGDDPSWPSQSADRLTAGAAIKDGKFDRAEAALRRVVEREPNDAAAQHDLGVALAKQGKLDEAIAAFGRALKLKPEGLDARRNLGVALAQRGQRHDAAACFQKAVDLAPDSAPCRHDWANALKALGKFDDAVVQYREAVRLKEDWAEGHHDLGLALAELKRIAEAEAAYREALRLKPEFPEALNNLGILLEGTGQLREAEAAYRQALEIKPGAADVHNNLGVSLAAQRKYEEAAASYRQALRLTPNSPLALNNLGNSLRALGEVDEAVRCLRQAIRLRPDYAEAYNNLGIALVQLGQDDDAVFNYERALYFRPDYPEAHLNRSLAWLAGGDFDSGWTEYEWRWKAKDVNSRTFRQRRWDGCDLHGRTLFVYLEQGVGDTLQFVRYARLLKQRGARVVFEVQKSLAKLLASCPYIDQVVAIGEPAPEFDLQAPLLSLPAIFGTTVNGIPADVPYLHADARLVEKWRSRICENSGGSGEDSRAIRDGLRRPPDTPIPNPQPPIPSFLVGIAWQGNPQYRGDRQRSIPLKCFAPLAAVPGVRLVSLQKGFGTEQLAELAGQFSVIDLGAIDEESGAFMDTAAIMANLDLVITSDTALPHLAGALAAPTWMALPAVADWRWMREGEGSPWYPTMRLFRRRRSENWDDLFARIAAALHERSKTPRSMDVVAERLTPRARQDEDDYAKAQREHHAGLVLAKEGKLAEAEERLASAVRLQPNFAAAHHNLGVVQARQKQVGRATKSFLRTLDLDPKFADAHGNLGLAYYEQGRFGEAVAEFRRALRLAPGSAETFNNLGAALMQQARPAEAVGCYRRALEVRPEYAEAHLNLARALLTLGQFEQGWLEHEWREKAPGGRGRPSNKPRWDGGPLAGRTLLLYAEQGLGDTLQFVRYAARVKQGGGRVALECQPALVRLLANRGAPTKRDGADLAARNGGGGKNRERAYGCGLDVVIAVGKPLPEHDVQAGLMSLPFLLRTTVADLPAEAPYLFADPALVAQWRARLAEVEGFKVGIAWQGNPAWVGDRYRSIPLDQFQPLADLPSVRLVNLQAGHGAEQLASAANRFQVIDFGSRVDGVAGPFMDTAAMMDCLDLVITSDTSIAHLAGGLGAPVWVALPFAADWRWMTDRHYSPWYPTMRLFRQPRPGDWRAVFARMAHALGERLSRGNGWGHQRNVQTRPAAHGQSHRVEPTGYGEREPSRAKPAGVNLTCPINHLGYGVVGLNLLKALTRAGVAVACWPIGRVDAGLDDQALIDEAIQRQKRFDGHAPSIRVAQQNFLAQHVGSPRIGFPIFELNRFTETELSHLRSQDRLFVASAWAKEIIESNLAVARSATVHVVPLGVDREIFHESADELRLRAGPNGEPEPTIFLSVGKWERRKGHDVLLEAFNKAFCPADEVELWMLAYNPVIANDRASTAAKNQQWESLYKSSPLASKIRVLPRLADRREVAATMRQADCGVFLSRAEGWNLPALEMLSCGRQIIITDYSAHTEYCRPENALLVDVDSLEDAHDDRWFFGHGQWAELGPRQLEQAVAFMRQVHVAKHKGRKHGQCGVLNQAGIETARRYSWDNTATLILDAL